MRNEDTKQNQQDGLHGFRRGFGNITAGIFSLILFTGIAVCAICNIAVSHTVSWSLYPISSIVFAWLVLIPIIRFGKKGICGSLVVCSICIAPYFLVLNKLIKISKLFLPVSLRMAFIGVVYLWIIFILFTALKNRKLLAAAITLLLAIPADLAITFTLSGMISESIDGWDIMGFSIVTIAAVILFILDSGIHKEPD